MICNNCGAYFHNPDTVREPLDDDFNGQLSFVGYQVCPECRSTNIEETNRCVCGEVKRKADDYCIHCTEIAAGVVSAAITDIKEFISRLSRQQARELLKDYVEENL